MNLSKTKPQDMFTLVRAELVKAAVDGAPPEKLEEIAEKGLNVLQLISDCNTAENEFIENLKTWIKGDLEVMKKGGEEVLKGLALKSLEALKALVVADEKEAEEKKEDDK